MHMQNLTNLTSPNTIVLCPLRHAPRSVQSQIVVSALLYRWSSAAVRQLLTAATRAVGVPHRSVKLNRNGGISASAAGGHLEHCDFIRFPTCSRALACAELPRGFR